MKHGILITAYKNPEQVIDIIKHFDENFFFYIHIDKKSTDDFSKLEKDFKNVYIFKEFVVNWGGLNHLKSILFLITKALKNKSIGYFHLISGQDYPIKTSFHFTNILDTTKDYLQFMKLPAKDNWLGNGGIDRIQYYNFYDLFDAKKHQSIINVLLKLQMKFGIKRSYSKIPNLYGGGTWWSLRRKSLEYIIEQTNSNNLLKRFKHTFCSEEIYIQTLLLNSEFKDEIVNDNLRFIDWESGRGGNPAFLDESDIEKITKSNHLFARKFNQTPDFLKNKL